MDEIEKVRADSSDTEFIEWEYASPPTPYDLIRDSFLMKVTRILVYFFIRIYFRFYNRLMIAGIQNALGNWPCIMSPNHSSHLDAPAVFAALPFSRMNNTYTLAAKDYFFNKASVTLWARLMANAIPVDRAGSESKGLRLCFKKQREGKSIIIFPEGTRSPDGILGSFHKGAVALSRKTRVVIVPVFIKGTHESLPKSRLFPKPKKIEIVFGEPIRYWEGNLSKLNDEEAASDLHNQVRNLGEK